MAHKHNIYHLLNVHGSKHSALHQLTNVTLFSAAVLPLNILAPFHGEEIGVEV